MFISLVLSIPNNNMLSRFCRKLFLYCNLDFKGSRQLVVLPCMLKHDDFSLYLPRLFWHIEKWIFKMKDESKLSFQKATKFCSFENKHLSVICVSKCSYRLLYYSSSKFFLLEGTHDDLSPVFKLLWEKQVSVSS